MSQILYEAFVANVRGRMATLGITQAELAVRLRVTPSYVSQILNGHRRPGLDNLEAFAKVLSVEPADLIRRNFAKTG